MSKKSKPVLKVLDGGVEEQVPMFDVMVAVPCGENVTADFARSLALMMGYSAVKLVAENIARIRVRFMKNTYIDAARFKLVQEAANAGCSHMLWLDSDMKFPKETLEHLLQRNKLIVGANYSTRLGAPRPVTFKHVDVTDQGGHVYCYTTPESTGLEQVDALGFGCVLVDMEVFYAKIKPPFFKVTWDDKGVSMTGEDVHFCQLARAAGVDIFVDHDLSQAIEHGGFFSFKNEHAALIPEAREAAAAELAERKAILDSKPQTPKLIVEG